MNTNYPNLTNVKGTLDMLSVDDNTDIFRYSDNLSGLHLKNVPRSLLNRNGSLHNGEGILNETYR